MTTATLSRTDAAERRATLITQAHRALRTEFAAAFKTGGQTLVRCPGFSDTRQSLPLADAIEDRMADPDSAVRWNDLISILGAAAQGEDVALQANVLILMLANAHAKYHASDLIDNAEDY